MNGHSGADGLVWRGKELSKRNDYDCKCSVEPLVVNAWQSFLIFFIYLLLSPCFVWATCALYSFILHKLEEAIYQKSSKNYIPQYVWQRAWASSEQQCAGKIMMTFFVDRDVSDIYFPSCLSISKGQGLPFEWFQAAGILLDVFHNEAKYTN